METDAGLSIVEIDGDIIYQFDRYFTNSKIIFLTDKLKTGSMLL